MGRHPYQVMDANLCRDQNPPALTRTALPSPEAVTISRVRQGLRFGRHQPRAIRSGAADVSQAEALCPALGRTAGPQLCPAWLDEHAPGLRLHTGDGVLHGGRGGRGVAAP